MSGRSPSLAAISRSSALPIMRVSVNPVRRHAQLPPRHDARAFEARIELRVALRQPCLARSRELAAKRVTLSKKPETLEHGTVAEPIGVRNQLLFAAHLLPQVAVKTIGDVLYSTANRRIGKNVDHRPVNVGDGDFALPPPHNLRTEELVLADMLEREDHASSFPRLGADRPRREHDDVAERLLGQ
jgi:hypothetical protein